MPKRGRKGHRTAISSLLEADFTMEMAIVEANRSCHGLGGEDSSIRLWDLDAEDDASDLLLGSHDGAAT